MPLYILLLTSIVLISKEILILHDETLVAFNFALFLVFFYNAAGDMITTELNERSEKIESEFESYRKLNIETLSLVLDLHKKQHNSVKITLDLFGFVKTMVKDIIAHNEKALKNQISLEINSKLATIRDKEYDLADSIRSQIK